MRFAPPGDGEGVSSSNVTLLRFVDFCAPPSPCPPPISTEGSAFKGFFFAAGAAAGPSAGAAGLHAGDAAATADAAAAEHAADYASAASGSAGFRNSLMIGTVAVDRYPCTFA